MQPVELKIQITPDIDEGNLKRISALVKEHFKEFKFNIDGNAFAKSIKEALAPLENIAKGFEKIKIKVDGITDATSVVVKNTSKLKDAVDSTSVKYNEVLSKVKEQAKLTDMSAASVAKLEAQYDKANIKVAENTRKLVEAQIKLDDLQRQGASEHQIAKATEYLDKMDANLRIATVDAGVLKEKFMAVSGAASKVKEEVVSFKDIYKEIMGVEPPDFIELAKITNANNVIKEIEASLKNLTPEINLTEFEQSLTKSREDATQLVEVINNSFEGFAEATNKVAEMSTVLENVKENTDATVEKNKTLFDELNKILEEPSIIFTEKIIDKYVKSYLENTSNNETSINIHLKNINVFLTWASDDSNNYIPIKNYLNKYKKIKPAYTETEYNLLLDYFESRNYEMYLFLQFLWNTGVRCGEALEIKLSDVDLEKNRIFVFNKVHKGKQEFLLLTTKR